MVKITLQIFKNTDPSDKPKLISFEKSAGFQSLLKICSEKLSKLYPLIILLWYKTHSLGISAKRIYKENGTEITDLFSVDNNDVLFISQVKFF